MVQQNLQIRFLARIGEEIQEIEKKKKETTKFYKFDALHSR